MTRKICLWLGFLFSIIIAPCSQVAIEVQAGPPSGSGEIQLLTSYENHWVPNTIDTAEGWGHVAGGIMPHEMLGNIYMVGVATPDEPRDISISFQFEGQTVSHGDPLTSQMMFLAENPLSSTTNYTLSQVEFVNGGYVVFTPAIQVSIVARANFYYSDEGYRYGTISTHVSVTGGMITNSYGELNVNDWEGPGPRPNWLSEVYGSETWSMRVTNPGTVHFTPEPATLALLGLVSLGFRRR